MLKHERVCKLVKEAAESVEAESHAEIGDRRSLTPSPAAQRDISEPDESSASKVSTHHPGNSDMHMEVPGGHEELWLDPRLRPGALPDGVNDSHTASVGDLGHGEDVVMSDADEAMPDEELQVQQALISEMHANRFGNADADSPENARDKRPARD